MIFSLLKSYFPSKKMGKKLKKEKETHQSIHQLKAKSLDGKEFSFDQLKGKKVLIVNTASKCGFTPQYEQLEELYQSYKDQNFEIIGFPTNDFMKQEPGKDEEIKTFCQKNYGVTFPMMSKISTKGEQIHPLYQYLTQKEKNGRVDSSVLWNFQKYLVNEEGELEMILASKTSPLDQKIINWIKK